MRTAVLKHPTFERMSIYTALESIDFHWDLKDVLEFDQMWNEGLHISDIARAFGRDVNEVAVLAMDRHIKYKIESRLGGLQGRRKR